MTHLQSKWTIAYQIATYSGEIEVFTEPNASQEMALAKARSQLRRRAGEFPFGHSDVHRGQGGSGIAMNYTKIDVTPAEAQQIIDWATEHGAPSSHQLTRSILEKMNSIVVADRDLMTPRNAEELDVIKRALETHRLEKAWKK